MLEIVCLQGSLEMSKVLQNTLPEDQESVLVGQVD